jgi:hypothetical protein
MKHVRDQNWFAVGLDFLIVVVGVFIGIQVSNWNEERQNRALAEDYRERLTTDLVTEQALWRAAIDYFETARSYGLQALEGFEHPPERLDASFLAAVYQASQVWYVAPNRATFDELQSTGRITLLEDPDLRTALANHYLRSAQTGVTLQQTSQYRRVARLHLGQAVQNAVRAQCGDRWVTDETNFYYVALPSSCQVDLPSELVRDEIAAIHANTEVEQELRFHLSVLDANLGVMRNTREIAGQTITRLRAIENGS